MTRERGLEGEPAEPHRSCLRDKRSNGRCAMRLPSWNNKPKRCIVRQTSTWSAAAADLILDPAPYTPGSQHWPLDEGWLIGFDRRSGKDQKGPLPRPQAAGCAAAALYVSHRTVNGVGLLYQLGCGSISCSSLLRVSLRHARCLLSLKFGARLFCTAGRSADSSVDSSSLPS